MHLVGKFLVSVSDCVHSVLFCTANGANEHIFADVVNEDAVNLCENAACIFSNVTDELYYL